MNKILEKLYETYSFLEQDITKFSNMFFSGISANDDPEEIEKSAKRNIIMYMASAMGSSEFSSVFDFTVEKFNGNLDFVFDLYDTVIKETEVSVSPEAIAQIANNKKYKAFFESVIEYGGKEYELLKTVIDAYKSFNEEEEISDDILYSNLSDDQLRDYILLVSNISVLTKEEEQALFRKYLETRDTEYKDEFIKHNLKLAIKVGLKYWKPDLKMSKMDLIQEANIGLLIAFDKFNPDEGCKFSTYSVWWMRQKVTRALTDQNDTIRIPVHTMDNILKKNRLIQKYQDEFGEDPTDEELAEMMDVSMNELEAIKKAEIIKTPSSIDKVIDNEDARKGRESNMSQFIADETTNVEDGVFNTLLREQLFKYMDECLTDREKMIICDRFGLNEDLEKLTLEQIGKKLNLTRERIRQIEAKALKKLGNKARSIKRMEENLVINTDRVELTEEQEIQRRVFRMKLRKKTKDTLTIVGFTDDNLRARVKCKNCGNSYIDTLENLLKQKECIYCSTAKKEKDQKKEAILKEYNAKLLNASDGKIKAISLDGKNNEKVVVECLDCGNVWDTYRYNLLYNPICPDCKDNKKKVEARKKLEKRIEALTKDIELVKYNNSVTKSTFRCKNCGNTWEELPYNLIKKPYCSKCKAKVLKKK